MRYDHEFISLELDRLNDVFDIHSEIGEWEEY